MAEELEWEDYCFGPPAHLFHVISFIRPWIIDFEEIKTSKSLDLGRIR